MVAPLSSGGTGQHIHFIVRVHQAHMTYQHLLAIWQAADSLGYDGASLYDLLAAPCLECWTTLTMLTMATSRLRAIPMVLSHTYRHPAVLAKMAATLDKVSEGRLMLSPLFFASLHFHFRKRLIRNSLLHFHLLLF
jgi:alkanesulfonate monooxygenase SsuD/methylene tetrahydromethanopterin reductase-like flavin-dependent oxidoreductase (luciferase family)